MKVIAINGSPRRQGNTCLALKAVGAVLQEEGIKFEIMQIGARKIRGCIACGKCVKNKDRKCVIKGDVLNASLEKMAAADGILLGSPVYYSGIAGTMKSFLDRAFYVAGANGGLFRQKVGASVAVARRSGGSMTFDSLNHYLTISEMHVVSSRYWNVAHGMNQGDVLQDAEGMQIMRILGRNMAWMLKMKKETKTLLPPPERERAVMTNFIR